MDMKLIRAFVEIGMTCAKVEELTECTECGKKKGKDNFYWAVKGVRRTRVCKKCHLDQCKKYAQTDKGKAATTKAQKNYVKKHSKTAEYKESQAKRSAKYNKTDKGRATSAAYKKTDKNKAADAAYQKSDKGKISAAKHAKTAKGKATRVRAKAKRRAREKDIINTLTGEQWDQILSGQGHTCNGCHKPFTEEKPATADHIHPMCDGGGTTEENIQALCFSCNAIKGPRSMEYLLKKIKEKNNDQQNDHNS